MLVSISCVLVPYQFAFGQATALSGFQVFYLLDLFLIADIVLNCFTTYRSLGIEIMDRTARMQRYARQMMPVDNLGSLPFDVIA